MSRNTWTLCPRADHRQAEFLEIEEVGRIGEVGRPLRGAGSAAARAEPNRRSSERSDFSPLGRTGHALERAERLRANDVEVGGERDERLRGRQRVAVGVVGPVHGQAERPRAIRRGRSARCSAGGRRRSRRSSRSIAAVSTIGLRNSESAVGRGRLRGSPRSTSATCATIARPVSASSSPSSTSSSGGASSRSASRRPWMRIVSPVRHPLRPHQLVAGVVQADRAARRPSRWRRR